MVTLRSKHILYIMLGIGIGIIFSALFFLLLPPEQATKEEIEQKAMELGMITAVEHENLQNRIKLLQDKKADKESPQAEIITVTIPNGSKSEQIGEILFNNGIITQLDQFQKLVKLLQIQTKLIASTYELEKDIDLGKLMLILTGGLE